MPRFLPAASGRCLLFLAALTLAGAGCRQARVESYRIPKELAAEPTPAPDRATPPEAPADPATQDATEPASAAVAEAGLAWTAPATWQSKPLGPMRKGSYIIAGPDGATADMSITAFPGAVGGELANLNRWRGQLGLAPIAAEDLAAATTHVTAGSLAFTVADLTAAGSQPQHILAAMTPVGGAMWFFKLTGSDALVAAHRAEFLALLQTVRATPAHP